MVLLNIVLLYKIVVVKKYHKDYLGNIKAYETEKMNAYYTNFQTGLLNDGIKVENKILIDSLNNKLQLIDLFEKRDNLLVCRFSELNCQECVIYSVVKLVRLSEEIGRNNIVFLGSYENNKSLHILKKQINLQNMNVYNIPYLDIPVENESHPCYFILDNTLTISNLFVPDKSVPDLTNSYLKTITNRYFINDN
jgi:hypothetical protein